MNILLENRFNSEYLSIKMESIFIKFLLFLSDKWRQHFRDNWNKDDSWGQTESIQNTYNNNGNNIFDTPCFYPNNKSIFIIFNHSIKCDENCQFKNKK